MRRPSPARTLSGCGKALSASMVRNEAGERCLEVREDVYVDDENAVLTLMKA